MKYVEFDQTRPMDLILLGRVAIDFNPAYNDQVKEEFKPLKDVHHTGNGFMPANEMSLQTELYEAYHDMGGNGTGTKLYNEMMELPHIKHTEVQ